MTSGRYSIKEPEATTENVTIIYTLLDDGNRRKYSATRINGRIEIIELVIGRAYYGAFLDHRFVHPDMKAYKVGRWLLERIPE